MCDVRCQVIVVLRRLGYTNDGLLPLIRFLLNSFITVSTISWTKDSCCWQCRINTARQSCKARWKFMIKPDGSNHDHDLRFGRSETENIREWPSWEILQKR